MGYLLVCVYITRRARRPRPGRRAVRVLLDKTRPPPPEAVAFQLRRIARTACGGVRTRTAVSGPPRAVFARIDAYHPRNWARVPAPVPINVPRFTRIMLKSK